MPNAEARDDLAARIWGSLGIDVGETGGDGHGDSCGRVSVSGPQLSMISASAALALWNR